MTKIYLVRHGQTEWNKKLTFRGRIDVPLNKTGHREAKALLDALKNKTLALSIQVHSSVLLRLLNQLQNFST